jgi:hypothetical protein
VLTLPRVARRHANVSDVSCFYNIMKSLHGFLYWRIVVEAVALQDINVVKLKSF